MKVDKDTVYIGEEGQAKLIAGFMKVADPVAGTLGAAGHNATVEHEHYPFSYTTNDGVSIAKAIHLADPVENIGASLAKEISSRSDKEGGDGTSTSLVLAKAIINEALPPPQRTLAHGIETSIR